VSHPAALAWATSQFSTCCPYQVVHIQHAPAGEILDYPETRDASHNPAIGQVTKLISRALLRFDALHEISFGNMGPELAHYRRALANLVFRARHLYIGRFAHFSIKVTS
jgi:hypothetical protein